MNNLVKEGKGVIRLDAGGHDLPKVTDLPIGGGGFGMGGEGFGDFGHGEALLHRDGSV